MTKCFSGERFSDHGDYWSVNVVQLYPGQVQQPTPPMYMAAVSPPSFSLAADYGLSILRAPRFTSLARVQGTMGRLLPVHE